MTRAPCPDCEAIQLDPAHTHPNLGEHTWSGLGAGDKGPGVLVCGECARVWSLDLHTFKDPDETP